MKIIKRTLSPVGLLAGATFLLLTGCSTYTAQSQKLDSAWQVGDTATAVAEATSHELESVGKKDELLWHLEAGTVLLKSGDIAQGIAAFDQADQLATGYEDAAKLQVGDETLALLSNQAQLPYQGRSYDKVMMNTYKAMGYLAMGDPDRARVELNRALQRQREAVADNAKQLEKAEAAAEESRQQSLEVVEGETPQGYDIQRAQDDARFADGANAELAAVDSRLLSYSDYVNPFSVFLDGLFFTHLGYDASDAERGRKSFERVKGMSPGNYISSDYEIAEALANGRPAPAQTYVIFATGSAPSRKSFRLDIPLFLVTDDISYIGASFPRLDYHDQYIPQMSAMSPDGQSYVTERICSMDAVVSRDYKNEWPTMVTKTLLTTATKAMIGYAAEQVTKKSGNQWTNLATKIVSTAYQASTNIADLRTWRTLPKEFSYLRLPTPEQGTVTIQVGAQIQELQVVAGANNVVVVRSVSGMSLPMIQQFTLK